MPSFTATTNSDGTFSLNVDGVPFSEDDDAKTTLTRDSLAALINDARLFFGDITVKEPDGDETPTPTPVPQPVPTSEPVPTPDAPPVPPAPTV